MEGIRNVHQKQRQYFCPLLVHLYIHHVLLFPMKLVAYSSAVWQIRCAVKWSMTESRARLDPLQSYTAITISSFLWGNTQRTGKKNISNLSEGSSGVAGERSFSPTPAQSSLHVPLNWICFCYLVRVFLEMYSDTSILTPLLLHNYIRMNWNKMVGKLICH